MGCRHLCPLEPLYTGVELIDQSGIRTERNGRWTSTYLPIRQVLVQDGTSAA